MHRISMDDMLLAKEQPLRLPTPASSMRTKKPLPPPFPAVLIVSAWALLSAGIFAFMVPSLVVFGDPACSAAPTAAQQPPPSSSGRCYPQPAVTVAVVGGLKLGGAAQAAAAVLAPLLPSRRRRAAALVALAATAASHCVFAWFAAIVYVAVWANPISTAWAIVCGGYVVVSAALALLCLAALLFLEEHDD